MRNNQPKGDKLMNYDPGRSEITQRTGSESLINPTNPFRRLETGDTDNISQFISTLNPKDGSNPDIDAITYGLENLYSPNPPPELLTLIENAIPRALEGAKLNSNYIEQVARLLPTFRTLICANSPPKPPAILVS